MTSPYDHHALWLKAKLFINRAMENDDVRTFDERALWASLGLELLAKAALARVSPLLIAEPTEDGTNLLVASGLVEGHARFTSVRAKTIYSRCHKAFKPFSESEAVKITHARNEYLHSSAAAFTSLPEIAWWPRFWTLAVILIGALDQEIEDLVGSDRVAVVEAHLEQNKKNVEHRTEMLIERARQRRAQHEAGTLPARIAAEWSPGNVVPAGLEYSESASCPACYGRGTLEGQEPIDISVGYEQVWDEDYERTISVTVSADYFSCNECGLILDSYQLVEQAGFESTFETSGSDADLSNYEPDYGND